MARRHGKGNTQAVSTPLKEPVDEPAFWRNLCRAELSPVFQQSPKDDRDERDLQIGRQPGKLRELQVSKR